MSDWWDAPYKKGTAVGPATLPRVCGLQPEEVYRGYDIDGATSERAVAPAAGGSGSPPSGTTCTGRCLLSARARGRSSDSGIRGIERQEGIPQDGIIDDVLYQKLRRILVPDGPHKGEPIFDGVCVQLLNRAAGSTVRDRRTAGAGGDHRLLPASGDNRGALALHPAAPVHGPRRSAGGDARERLLELRLPRLLLGTKADRRQGGRSFRLRLRGLRQHLGRSGRSSACYVAATILGWTILPTTTGM